MTLVRYIHHVATERPAVTETATEARERLRDKFPRNALRRMTHLGMLVGATLDGVTLSAEDAVVYATSFAETRALEEFLTSFPTPSPLLFQTSIHPSGVQQVLIARQQAIGRLWPLASRARLVEQALLTALVESAPRVVVTGGEERGTWLLERGVASASAFAFALVLAREPAGALGRVEFVGPALVAEPSRGAPDIRNGMPTSGSPTLEQTVPTLEEFCTALAGRRALAWQSAAGEWSVVWS